MNLNKVFLVGNLTKEVESKYLPNGKAVANFSIAVNRKYKDADEVGFFDIVAFGKTAEVCAQYLGKGKGVLVEGRLQQRRWETDEGQKRSKIEIVADNIQFMPKGGDKPDTRDEGEMNEADLPF